MQWEAEGLPGGGGWGGQRAGVDTSSSSCYLREGWRELDVKREGGRGEGGSWGRDEGGRKEGSEKLISN